MNTLSWYSDSVPLADLYPVAVRNLLNVANDRRSFFEDMINPEVQPNVGYRALANILHAGWVRTVLTANFDECVQRASIIQNRPHHLVSIKTPSDLIRFSSAPENPQLVYLHGSVEHLTDRNLDTDVQDLDAEIVDRVKPLLRDHPVIVIGYRGAEPSIMRRLFLDNVDYANRFYNGIYWCVLDREIDLPLPPMVAELAARIGGNFNKVGIRHFDDLLDRELWHRLSTEGHQPTRQPSRGGPIDVPFDMRVQEQDSVDDLDLVLLFTRLREYALVLSIAAPDAFDREWTLSLAETFHLIGKPTGNEFHPTVAGNLLFSKGEPTASPGAHVRLRAKGPERWLRQCFGDDADFLPQEDDSVYEVDIRGNLWSQLDQLTEILSLVNRQFRLKQEVSRQARSYNPLALKEMIVNALVHRNYETDEAVEIEITPASIQTVSPGGLVDAVVAQMYDSELEALIKSGRRSIKGYRNSVISDLFYGGGQMDHTGSGLSDMWRETVNNNGDVTFGPTNSNTRFEVAIRARQEAVDEITNTAVADESQVTRYSSNILPISAMPEWVWHAGTTAGTNKGLYHSASGLPVPPGLVQDGRFYTLFDLEELADGLVTPFDVGDIEAMRVDELLLLPNGTNILIHLLQDAVLRHCRALGMQVDWSRKRAHFPRYEDGDERRVTYQARYKRATRTVVKVRMRRDSDEVSYYEHKALSVTILPAGEEWCLILSPGYAFTRNGFGKLIGNEKINSLSTRRAAKDFNASVHNDLTFWLAMLIEGQSGLFSLLPDVSSELEPYAPNIVISDQLVGASLNSSAFDDLAISQAIADDEMDELDTELMKLADMDEVENPDDNETDQGV
ncbi:SIR2 family protein [Sphingomonas natans]|nr:SIR2 family protein [Sphingomonas sp. BIUV-7]